MMRMFRCGLVGGTFLIAASAAGQVVRIAHDETRRIDAAPVANGPLWQRGEDPCCAAPGGFTFNSGFAGHGQAVPGGGTLSPLAFINPAVANRHGALVFVSDVAGASRNQGVFVLDGGVLSPIAMSCGGGGGSGTPGGGCGDPTPLGGTFNGFFTGTFFAPAINDNGDVLFLADVENGAAPRGLFLYRADTDDIVTVAAVGDASPLGGTLAEVGPGAINDARQVVFIAVENTTQHANYYKWDDGVLTSVARVGEAAPDGGTFLYLGRESVGFIDGTFMPAGLVPAINNAGEIVFWASTSGGTVERGFVKQVGAARSWIVRVTDSTPAGGVYLDFFGPLLSDSGLIAFYADVRLGQSEFTGGWFVGEPGNLRKALTFFDPLPGGECYGLAVSRSPIINLDDCGGLMLWANIRQPSMIERESLVYVSADGSIQKVAQQATPSPIGGNVGAMNAWGGYRNRHGVLSCGTPGAPGGVFNAHIPLRSHLQGDLNGDGSVGLDDVAVIVANFGMTSGATFAQGDLDGDGDVDLEDVALLVGAFGTACE